VSRNEGPFGIILRVDRPRASNLAAMTGHRLDPTPETTRDIFSRDHAPVLTVDPGDTVTVGSLDASGYLARQTHPGQVQPTMFAEARGH